MVQLYPVDEAARILGIDRKQAYQLIWAGDLEAVDVKPKGNKRPRLRVASTEIERFIRARRMAAAAQTAA